MTHKRLETQITFSAIYGDDKIFVGRSSPNATRWLPKGDITLDMFTTGLLTVLGDMPVLCAATVSTPAGLDLLREAGFHLPSAICRYVDVNDYMMIIRKMCAEGRVIVTQHVHPVDEIQPERSWIDPAVLSFINNKANLCLFVPDHHTPVRSIMPAARLLRENNVRWPVVVKAATDESTGGGADVRICRCEDDMQEAAAYFEDCRYLVVEEYLDIQDNYCLSYFVSREGNVHYLGFAEQVSDEHGLYRGNWIDDRSQCPADIVEMGKQIAGAAFGQGYYGVLGMDVAVNGDGQYKVFDLNFRGNGSTPAVLFMPSIHRCYGKPLMRFRRFTGKGDYRQMLDAVYQGMAGEIFLPLGSCDPSVGSYPGERPLVAGLVLGNTRPEILENERRMVAFGLST